MAESRAPWTSVVTESRKASFASHTLLDDSGPWIKCHCIILPASAPFDFFEDREGVSIEDVASDADLGGVKGSCLPSLFPSAIAWYRCRFDRVSGSTIGISSSDIYLLLSLLNGGEQAAAVPSEDERRRRCDWS